jgi:hypothetical protein
MRRYLLLLFAILLSVAASAQEYLLTGHVTDEHGKPIAFASVYIKNSTYGTATNEQGNYEFKLNGGTYAMVYRYPGYKETTENITINSNTEHNMQLVDETYQYKQFKRVKGNTLDSAVTIIREVIKKRGYYLSQVNAYSCVVYVKGVQKLVSAPRSLMGQSVTSALNVDSTGKGILYQVESLSNLNFQQPGKVKEQMIATRSAGQNTSFSYGKASDLSANFYQNLFTISGLSSHSFVSPIASNALKFYNYNLLGSKVEDGITVYKIQVIPKHTYGPVFTGNIYIVDGDWRLYGVDLVLTGKANQLNLVDTLQVSQQYVPIKDSVWLPLALRYSFRGNVVGFKFEGYYLGIYNHYNLDPKFADNYFDGEIMRADSQATNRNGLYWQQTRPIPLTKQEYEDYNNKDELAALKRSLDYMDMQEKHNNFYVLPYIPFGWHASFRHDRDSLYLFPFLNTLFYNTVEGVGLNLKATYSHYYNDLSSYSLTPDIRYGFADNQLNASLNGNYTYDPVNRGKFYGGFGSDVLDLNNVGTRSLYFNTLSTLLSERNFVKYYRSEYLEGGFEHNLTKDLFLQTQLSYANRTQMYNNSYFSFKHNKAQPLTSNNPLAPNAPADDRSELFPENQALTLYASLTYTFDQQYIDRPSGRTYLPSPYPHIKLNYRKGISGLFGSDVNYDFASLEVYHDHFDQGLMGYSAFKVVAGDFFNKSTLYFMDYNHFQGNQGTTFDPTPGSFHFLPFYTYSAGGAFLEAHYEHNFTGSLFNNIGFLRKLKLEEIVGANYLTESTNRDYKEFYVGIQRLIFRLDYGIAYAGNKKYAQGIRIFYGIK